MFVKVDDQKVSIGTLSIDKFPQISFDLLFEKEFELSHTSKSSSVFFSGYKVPQPADGEDFDSEEESEGIYVCMCRCTFSIALVFNVACVRGLNWWSF
jgi:hypothetical protein